MCVIATCWGRPSIVEMSVDNAACGTQYILPGTGKGGAERLFRPNSPEARVGTGHSYTHCNGQTTSASLPLLFPIPQKPCFSLRSCTLADGDRVALVGC